MATYVHHHQVFDNFAQISNFLLRDRNITHKARGVMCQILSHKAGWVSSEQHLVSTSKEGRTSIRSALAELEKYGYLVREVMRNEDGTVAGSRWHTTGDPVSHPLPMFKAPLSENQTLDNATLK